MSHPPRVRTLLIVAGDPSGDVYGAELARSLKASETGIRIASVGGRLLRSESDEFLFDLASLGVTGFLEPLRRLPLFLRLAGTLRRFLHQRHPAAVVCIDYYGFNRLVLKAARKAGVRTFYYVGPQVWASRPGRIRKLRRLVDRMLVIFPFEEALYRAAAIPAIFVGHPLLDRLPAPIAPNDIPATSPLKIGLLPGSRLGELRRHLPLMLMALEGLRRDYPLLEACAFAAPHLPDEAYAPALRAGLELVRETDYFRRSQLDLAFTSSGTATLENALLGIPMVVVYRMGWPSYAIARSLIRVPFIAMVNLLAGKALAPELIQHRATPAALSRCALDLLGNPERLRRLRQELLDLRGKLGRPETLRRGTHPGSAAERAAQAILEGLA